VTAAGSKFCSHLKDTVMTTAVIKSFKADRGIVIVKVDERSPGVALRLCGSDRTTVAKMLPGQRIQFEFACDRKGNVFGIDVTPVSVPTEAVGGAGPTSTACAKPSRRKRPADPVRHFIPLKGRALPDEPGKDNAAETTLEELLAAPVIRKMMERDQVDPQAIRSLISSLARAVIQR